MRYLRPSVLIALVTGAVSCGGGTTQPPPPPGPPPPPPIGATLNMALGEVRVLSDVASIRAFQIAGAADAREYQVIVMSGGEVEGGFTPIDFTARASGAGASVAPRVTTRLPSTSTGQRRAARELSALNRLRTRPRHLELRSRMELEARRARARFSPKARGRNSTGAVPRGVAANVLTSGVPAVGETITILSAITPQGGLTCNGSTPVDGVVKKVGQNFIILEDPAVAGHLTAQDYADLDTELDAFVAPIDNEYFGTPADLDANERVIVFFTGQVNRLNPPGSNSIVIGFFTALDLLDPVDCPSSNEGEIIWLIGPDPGGSIGPNIPASLVKTIARGLVAHEYQHLLNAEQRFIIGDGGIGEEIWMNEGMSHIAEEAAGLFRIGARTRGGLGFNEIGVGGNRDAFDDFHRGNFLNLEAYLSAPTEVAALSAGNPPDSFPMRGWGYLFLRWLGDRYGPPGPEGLLPGSGEQALYRALAQGGPNHLTGIANVLNAINVVSGESPTWGELLAQYFAAPAIDEVASVPPALQFSTWNFPRLYSEMRENSIQGLSSGFPLKPTSVAMGDGASSSASFDLGASTARYFRFWATGPHSDIRVELTAPSGANVPNGARARVIVVRTG